MFLAVSQVPGHLCKPLQLAIVVIQCGDDDVRPELAAVLADTPVFVLDTAELLGDFQLTFRLLSLGVFLRVERREVLAYDLLRLISFRLLGAFVPCLDISVRIHEENSIVLHILNQELVTFKLGQGFLVLDLQLLTSNTASGVGFLRINK